MTPEDDKGDYESISTRFTRLEGIVRETARNVTDLKTAQLTAVEMLDKRVAQLEEVRIRALEDWRLAEKVREQERDKQADREVIAHHQIITRRDAYVGVLVMAVITILGSLIASGQIF